MAFAVKKFDSNLLDEEEQVGLDDAVHVVMKTDQHLTKGYKWEKLVSVDYMNPFLGEVAFREKVKDKEGFLFVFGGIENDEYTKYGAFCSKKFEKPAALAFAMNA